MPLRCSSGALPTLLTLLQAQILQMLCISVDSQYFVRAGQCRANCQDASLLQNAQALSPCCSALFPHLCRRRLKRLRMAERMEKCIWRRTPSPSPDADSPKRHRCGHCCMLLAVGPLQHAVPAFQTCCFACCESTCHVMLGNRRASCGTRCHNTQGAAVLLGDAAPRQ